MTQSMTGARLPPDPRTFLERQADEDADHQRAARGWVSMVNRPKAALHENLRAYRLRAGLKQVEMAALMGVTPRTYSSYEKGERSISSKALVGLAVHLDADMNEVMLGRSPIVAPEVSDLILDASRAILCFLGTEYPTMDVRMKGVVLRHALRKERRGHPRIGDDDIRDAVRSVTRYRFHPEDLPGPPDGADYGDENELFDEHYAEWLRVVQEDFGPLDDAGQTRSYEQDAG